ncbi:MAG: OmpA family protein [Chitinophagales bacterium]
MKNRFLFLLIACSITASTFAQSVTYERASKRAKDRYDAGNNFYAFGRYAEADSMLKLALESERNFIEAHWLLGNIYLENQRNNAGAVTELKKVEELNPQHDRYLIKKIGHALFNNGQYDEAKTYYQKFRAQHGIMPEDEVEADQMIRNADFAKKAVSSPVAFKPENLGPAVNSTEDDYMPALTADQHWLYFTRMERIGRAVDENIFISENRHGVWTLAEPISEAINTLQYNEGAHSISQSGRYLFFTSCNRPESNGGCDIYFSKRTGNDWDRGKNLNRPINSAAWETQPYLAGDGRTLFFVSNRNGGYGGADIYMTQLGDDGKWSEPQNLGPNINTKFDEERPFIHPDGFSLYFASKGHDGMGGSDLFVSRKQADGTWGTPINLGYPINTSGDELGLYVTPDGINAYFSSEQPDTKGGLDIYRFALPENVRPYPTCYVKGVVSDAQSKAALGSKLQFIDLQSGLIYTTGSSDPKTGEYLVTLPTGKNYACQISKDGYLFYSANFSLAETKEGQALHLDAALQPFKIGESVVLSNVFFSSNSYTLLDASKSELNTLIDLLNKNATLKIEIGGHTDNSGLEKDNLLLSEQRAKAVYDFLISKGISAERLSYKGFAATHPIADNATAEGRQKNRRTEFKVVGI